MSETPTVKEEKSSPLPTEQLFPLNIKIKQEKTTDSSKSETVDKLSIDVNLTNIFSATTTTSTATVAAPAATDETEKETKAVEPLKSSNEILTELFKVFNAAPPEIVEDDSNEGEEEGGKKKKHKKHKKKSKKRKKGENGSGSSSESEPEEGEIKKKAKKIKKEKDKDKSKRKKSKEKDKVKVKKEKGAAEEGAKKDEKVSVKTEITSVVVKKEPRDDRYGSREARECDDRYGSREARERDDRYSSRDSRDTRDGRDARDARDSYHHSHHHHHHGSTSRDDHHPRIKQERDDRSYRDSSARDKDREKDREREKERERERERDREEPKSKGRIQIKSLKDSTIFKEAAAVSSSREKQRSRERDRTTSEGRSKSREMHRRRRSDSDFSMSDEETYKQGQGRYYDFYQKKYNSFYASYRDEEYDRARKRKRSEDRDRYRKSKSRSRSPQFDKQKLLEIARKNAITMLKKGTLPGAQGLDKESKEKLIMKMKSSGKTIDELTNFCKKISEKENLNELSSVSSDDSDHDAEGGSKAFHHPFQLKDHGPIVMNIKNSVPLQPKSAEQTKALLLQYPVSSGAQHRKMENEWVPVDPPTTAGPLVPLVRPDKATPKLPITASFVPQVEKQQPAYTPVNPAPLGPPAAICQPGPSTAVPPVGTPNLPIDIPNALPAPPVNPTDGPTPEVFPSNPEGNKLDVSTIISNRLNAMRKLQDNPADAEAIKLLYNTQKDMSAWASSKFTPGQFLGSTGAQVLTPRELAEGYQPWVTKDSMKQTAPVTGGMGMHLLQKMGWVPGEGLGKEKNGSLEPLLLDVKLDKRGLVASAEEHQRQIQFQVQQQHNGRGGRPRFTNVKINVDGKHPVSILGEYASKRKWNPPRYDLVHESGPGHAKNFVFKVIVNGLEYQPAISNNTKKDAKATAARFCLQQLGILQS